MGLQENPWALLPKAYSAAKDFRKKTLAFFGIIISFGLVLLFLWAGGQSSISGASEPFDSSPWEEPLKGLSQLAGDVLGRLGKPLVALLGVLTLFLFLLLWAFIGGAILRSAAMEVIVGKRIPLSRALGFAKKKFSSFLWPPIHMVLGCLVFLALIALLGLVGGIPAVGKILLILLLPLILLFGMIAALIGLKGFAAFPLMGPAVAVEGVNSFGALSRAFGYLSSEPYLYLLFTLKSILNLLLGLVLKGLFLLAVLLAVYLPIKWGNAMEGDDIVAWLTGNASLSATFFGPRSPFLSSLLLLIFSLLLAAELVTLFYTNRICLYLFFRWKVDKIELNLVNLCDETAQEGKAFETLGFSLEEEQ